MELKKNKLSKTQLRSLITEFERYADYKEFQDEFKFLVHGLWLDRTTRWSDPEMNQQTLEHSKRRIEEFKDHLDEVFEDITSYQLHKYPEEEEINEVWFR